MNVSLTAKLEGYVKAKVKSGNYNNASEVIREALRGMQERDEEQRVKIRNLRAELRRGEASGPAVAWNPADVKAEAYRRARKSA